MKATGIVRRMDDLGRVVVPKELRRTMKIRHRHGRVRPRPQHRNGRHPEKGFAG